MKKVIAICPLLVVYRAENILSSKQKNSRENVYIQSAKLNGKTLSKNFIRYKDRASGGGLSFEMEPAPKKKWGTLEED